MFQALHLCFSGIALGILTWESVEKKVTFQTSLKWHSEQIHFNHFDVTLMSFCEPFAHNSCTNTVLAHGRKTDLYCLSYCLEILLLPNNMEDLNKHCD